jgi:hypothetical protein
MITVDYLGVTGRGKTIKEAKADAHTTRIRPPKLAGSRLLHDPPLPKCNLTRVKLQLGEKSQDKRRPHWIFARLSPCNYEPRRCAGWLTAVSLTPL